MSEFPYFPNFGSRHLALDTRHCFIQYSTSYVYYAIHTLYTKCTCYYQYSALSTGGLKQQGFHELSTNPNLMHCLMCLISVRYFIGYLIHILVMMIILCELYHQQNQFITTTIPQVWEYC